ncbi:hypothetical protein HY251_00340, partial [bacterium]|nr:hypothetical protein [bacterium]
MPVPGAPVAPPRLGRAIAVLAAALVGSVFSWTPLQDRDWPWHLANHERMLREHALPWNDVWSYASEGDNVPVHWLFELVLGAAHSAFGLDGISLVRGGLVALVFAALARALMRRGLGPVAASAVSITVPALSRIMLIERPHLVTMLGLVVLVDVLVDFRDRGRKRLLLLPVVFCLWANSHPGVVYGAVLAGAFAVVELARVPLSRRFRSLRAMPRERALALAGWVALGLLATLATPYGPRLYPYLLSHISLQRDLNVLELRSLDLTNKEDIAFVGALALAGLIAARGWREIDLNDAGATVAFAALGLLAPRESALALLVAALAIAPALADTILEARDELRDKEKRLRVFAWVFALALGFGYPAWALARPLKGDAHGSGLRKGAYPVREADWILRERPAGPLWNTNASGGYLIWRLDPIANPDWRVFTDGRQPLFPRALRMTFVEAEKEWAPNLLVLDFQHLPWVGELDPKVRERYALVHFSDGGRTYVRREGPNAALAAHALAHVGFSVVKDEGARNGLRTGIQVDSVNPAAALEELERGALSEDPRGAWANIARARALAL